MIRSLPAKDVAPVEDHSDRQIFDFFGLPRELRDEIYSILGKEVEIVKAFDDTGRARELQVTVADVMLPEVQTLSRQFKTEYDENHKRGTKIIFEDFGGAIRCPAIGDRPDLIAEPRHYFFWSVMTRTATVRVAKSTTTYPPIESG
jgi:hypothetical protein